MLSTMQEVLVVAGQTKGRVDHSGCQPEFLVQLQFYSGSWPEFYLGSITVFQLQFIKSSYFSSHCYNKSSYCYNNKLSCSSYISIQLQFNPCVYRPFYVREQRLL